MEYIYFIGVLAVLDTAFNLIWYVSSLRENGLQSRWRTDPQQIESIPPRKSTISVLSEKDFEHIEVQDRLDSWRRLHQLRWGRFRKSADAIKSKKYVYEPLSPSRARRVLRHAPPSRVRQQFELLS